MTKQKKGFEVCQVDLPLDGKTVIKAMVARPDIKRITVIKEFPINTRYVANDSRAYRYVVDKEGYRWIGEELWQLEKR